MKKTQKIKLRLKEGRKKKKREKKKRKDKRINSESI